MDTKQGKTPNLFPFFFVVVGFGIQDSRSGIEKNPGSATPGHIGGAGTGMYCMYLRAEAKLASLYDAGEGKLAPVQGHMLLQPTPRRGLLVVHLHNSQH